MPQDGIYLDYNASTPTDPAVFEAMRPYFLDHYGNPSSVQHGWGRRADEAVQKARAQVAGLIGAQPGEIQFNSGATEGNNSVFFGVVHALRAQDPAMPIHILTGATEHNSVRNAGLALRQLGVDVDVLPVDGYGRVDPAQVARALKPHTKLLSFIWVNNEIGTVNPVRAIGELARREDILFHSDATQAAGKIPVNAADLPVDLLSFSAHKLYGPKGVGALYMREAAAARLAPFFCGGGQERGRRSGTVNVPGVVGFGAAAELCARDLSGERERMTGLRDRLWAGLRAKMPAARLNGHPEDRSPTTLSVTFPGSPVESAAPKLKNLGFSTGSACNAGRINVSHVLKAIGMSDDDATCTVRLSVGRWTTTREIDEAVGILHGAFS